jgi:hypothetical protein
MMDNVQNCDSYNNFEIKFSSDMNKERFAHKQLFFNLLYAYLKNVGKTEKPSMSLTSSTYRAKLLTLFNVLN